MKRINCFVDFLKENDNVTVIADREAIIDTLFAYCENIEPILIIGRYDKNEDFLMISKIGRDIVVESIIGYHGEIYYMDSTKIIMTREAMEFVISKNSLDNVIDECEEFQVV